MLWPQNSRRTRSRANPSGQLHSHLATKFLGQEWGADRSLLKRERSARNLRAATQLT